MMIAYMISAVVTAIVCTAIWLLSGGGVLSAFLVYVLSGNLAIVALVGFRLIRNRT